MKFAVVTVMPELMTPFCEQGLVGQAYKKGLLNISVHNPREMATDVHRTIDDRAFGGGDGMVMMAEPLMLQLEKLRAEGEVLPVVLSPQGKTWTQARAREWSQIKGKTIALFCGRYGGMDHRFVLQSGAEEISIGDYVLNGGELAAMVVIESTARLLPGFLGNVASAVSDSFSKNLLEAPQYTRPREWRGQAVPSPLLSGHHAEIEKFLGAVSLVRTFLLRPDLVQRDQSLVSAARSLEKLNESDLAVIGLKRVDLTALLEGV